MTSQKGIGLNPRAVKLRYLDRSAEEAGRQKRNRRIPNSLLPANTVLSYSSIDDIYDVENKQEFGTYYPKRFIKSYSDRAQLDKLGAIHGLLKAYEGKTFDEFYSAFKTGCSQNSTAAMHVAQHAMENLHTQIQIIDGVIWGNQTRGFGPRTFQLKKNDYYVNCDGIITRVMDANLYPPKVYTKRNGFWADVYIKVKGELDKPTKRELRYRYVIGPFCSQHIKKSELESFELEVGFSNKIIWKPGAIRIKSNIAIDGHYSVKDWKHTYWCPQYYLVLDPAKLQTDPNSFKARKPEYYSIGTVIYAEDIMYPI